MTTSPPRGVRNKNHPNIKASSPTYWLGQIGLDSLGHAIFCDEAFGFRACLRDISGDILKRGQTTLTKLFAEYAPKDDPNALNNPNEYALYVSRDIGLGPDDDLRTLFNRDGSTANTETIRNLLRAIDTMEVGAANVCDQAVYTYAIYMYNRDFRGK